MIHISRKCLNKSLEGAIQLHTSPCRFAYAPTANDGFPEYIFAYRSNLPTEESEAELFELAEQKVIEENKIKLFYNSGAEIIFITLEADDEWREIHKNKKRWASKT